MLPAGPLGFLSAFSLPDDQGSSHVIFHHCESGRGCCLESEPSTLLLQAAICGLPGLPPSGKCVRMCVLSCEGNTGGAHSTIAS